MKVIDNTGEITEEKTAVALGTFDGLHIAHRKIICDMIKNAGGLPTVVCTFGNLPSSYFCAESAALFTPGEKAAAMEELGIDYLYMVDFDENVANRSASDFMDFLFGDMRAKKVWAGFNYTFGKDAEGGADMLLCEGKRRGADVFISPQIAMGGVTVSSSRIRAALLNGDVLLATKLMGRSYEINGIVTEGKKLGRKLGFPTINYYIEKGKLCPRHGVYGTITRVGERWYPSITNIGIRPTVDDGNAVNVESNIVGFDGDIYGEHITTRLVFFHREEKKFETVKALKAQLAKDKDAILADVLIGEALAETLR